MAQVDDPAAVAAARQILGIENGEPADGRAAALLETFYALAQLTPRAEVPEHLADRLAVGLVDTPRPSGVPPGEAPGHTHAGGGAGARLRRLFARSVRVPAVALALLILGLALSIAANVLQTRSAHFRPETALHLEGTPAAPAAKGVVLRDGSNVMLHAEGLSQLMSGNRYVAWAVSEDSIAWLGTLTMLDTQSARLLTSSAQAPETVVVTIESTASPPAPSGPRVLAGSASR